MNERPAKDVGGTCNFSSEITSLNDGRVLRFRLLCNGTTLSWSDVIDRWQSNHSFRSFFISILIDVPFSAYFWETPPLTDATTHREFEFVLVDSPRLAGIYTDQQAFADQFALARADVSVIEFSNLV